MLHFVNALYINIICLLYLKFLIKYIFFFKLRGILHSYLCLVNYRLLIEGLIYYIYIIQVIIINMGYLQWTISALVLIHIFSKRGEIVNIILYTISNCILYLWIYI